MRTLLALLSNLVRLVMLPFWALAGLLGRPRSPWVFVRVGPRLRELRAPPPPLRRLIDRFSPRPTGPTLGELRRLADAIRADPRRRGLVISLRPLHAGWATVAALRDLLTGLRDAGKEVVLHLPDGGGSRELLVAAGATRVLASPRAQISTLGLSATVRHVRTALDRVGVTVEVTRRGEYKTAAEPATDADMSAAQREQLEALLGTVDREVRAALAARVGEARVEAVRAQGFLLGDAAAESGGLDGACYEDELARTVAGRSVPAGTVFVPWRRYLSHAERRPFRPIRRAPHIAVVPIHGAIVGEAGGLPTRRAAVLEPTLAALRSVERDRAAVGVILHIDSPGGSASASDLIHRAVRRIAQKKPIVACFGDVAASGGYYVGAGATAIVAHPLTVTGSIGVIMAKLNVAGLFERLGISSQTLRTSDSADMLGPDRPLTEAERALLDRETEAFYRAFVAVVAQGRGQPAEAIDRVARGRVWSGAHAAERGLVDRLGGLDAARDEVAERLTTLTPARRARLKMRLAKRPRRAGLELPAPPLLDRVADWLPDATALLVGPGPAYYAAGLPDIR